MSQGREKSQKGHTFVWAPSVGDQGSVRGDLQGTVWIELRSVPPEDQEAGGLTHWRQSQAD